ncbi:MAG: YncE family protein [Betaproteobacteria bacterium]|nr:YncE family protein [Betaproteobacteria bacterium]
MQSAGHPTQSRGPVFVLNSRDATVSLIDPAKMVVLREVGVGKEPHHLFPTPDASQLIVASAMSNELHIFDPLGAQITQRIRQIDDPYQLGFSPDRKWFATAALRLDRVDVYRYSHGTADPFQLVKRIALSKAPSHLWFSADSRSLLVTLQDSGELALIDLIRQEMVWKMSIGALAAGVIITADDQHALVGVMGEDHVAVLDWRQRQLIARIPTGKGAHNFRGAGDRRHIYVSNRVENTISLLDTKQWRVVSNIAVPGGPDCMEIAADLKTMWVTSRFARAVQVLDLPSGRIVQRIAVGRSPHGIFMHQRAPWL